MEAFVYSKNIIFYFVVAGACDAGVVLTGACSVFAGA